VEEAAAVVVAAVAERVSASVLAEAEEVAVVAVAERAAGVPASVNTLDRRKAKRLPQHQRESLYPHLAGARYCG
jgi:hypothetical protein